MARLFFKSITGLFLFIFGITAAINFIFAYYAAADDADGYLAVTGPCRLEFPADHGAHPGFRTEWWYVTGNVNTPEDRPFGFQVTIFRRQISAPDARSHWPDPPSAWRTQQLYLGHAAVTDISGQRHMSAEEVSRGVLDLAGVLQTESDTTVFLKNWQIRIGPRSQRLQAAGDDFVIDLELTADKAPVLHGDRGYSRKGDKVENASCYYSFTRLQTKGRISLNGREFPVSGSSWMDHEFSTAPLQADIQGWDWFSLQLDNGTDVMIYLLRQEDGKLNPASSGTFVGSDGTTHHLSADDFKIDVLAHWKSPHSGGRYPARWQVSLPYEGMVLSIAPGLADQEMRTPGSTGVTYWEGSVTLSGEMAGRPVAGKGYVELTGYAKAFEQPL